MNNDIAVENSKIFQANNVCVINIMGSPGAGKTSLLIHTGINLKDELNIGVIEGDIVTTYDAELIQDTIGVDVVQINTDGACHLDANMIKNAIKYFDLSKLNLIFIENVGNLVCPANFRLGEQWNVAVLSVPEGDDKPRKYPSMFRVVDCVILNKIDLLDSCRFDIVRFKDDILNISSKITILEVSCKTNQGLNMWFDWLRDKIKSK
jgi:hydrogenase nickel incorporation protein HypB